LVHCLPKLALLARCVPEAEPRARAQLSSVLPLALLHHNGLLHLSDTLLLAQPVSTLFHNVHMYTPAQCSSALLHLSITQPFESCRATGVNIIPPIVQTKVHLLKTNLQVPF
jgi:hypothetical protein